MATGIRRFAPAKLNLYLHVTGRRADGYHELDSLAVFLDVGDEVVVRPAHTLALDVRGSYATRLAGAENLVLRAARALAATVGKQAEAAIELTKNLPVAAGLGGGSSDAAAALLALAELWGAELASGPLDALALALGADVPVCLRGRPQLMSGIGEKLADAPALAPFAVVLLNPGVALATADVFGALSGPFGRAQPLTGTFNGVQALARELARRRNDLELPARRLAPVIGEGLEALTAAQGCLFSRMSGSGATCFGLFADRAQAREAAKSIALRRPGWWVRDAEPWAEARAGTSGGAPGGIPGAAG